MISAGTVLSPFRRCSNVFWSGKTNKIISSSAIILFLFASASVYKGEVPYKVIVMQYLRDDDIKFGDPVVSYCSGEADYYGPNQNVISYSLYGDFSNARHYARYAEPIKYILPNISQVYPGLFPF